MTDGHILEEGKAARVRRHLQENKKTYLISAGASAGTLVVGVILGHRLSPTVIAPVFNNSVAPVMNNTVNNTMNNVGHCCKIVQGLDDDDKLWPKAGALAAELATEHGITFDAARTMLSKHLNGHSNDVFGKHYVTYGLGTTG